MPNQVVNFEPDEPFTDHAVTAEVTRADGAYARQVGIRGLSMQSAASTPVDQSSVVNAAIAACAGRLASATAGQMKILLDSPGVVYGSFEMMTGVSIELGPSTLLAAMPNQSSSVVDYHSADALHTVLSGGRIFGNYRNGATARCIDMTSSNSDAGIIVPLQQSTPQPDFPEIDDTSNPNLFLGEWSNPYNTVRDIMVYDCGGDKAVIFGRNQRASQGHNIFVQNAKGIGYEIYATDSFHSNIDVGVCGDCIVVHGPATKIANFKAWYAKRNTGYKNGNGDGIRLEFMDWTGVRSTWGDSQFVGETQDNLRYGWAFLSGHGIYARGSSCGDFESMIYLGQDGAGVGDARQNDIEISHSRSDLGGPKRAIILDSGAPFNTVVAMVDPGSVDASFAPIEVRNVGTLDNNEFTVCFGMKKGYVNVGVVTGTYNPPQGFAETLALTANGAVTIGPSVNLGYRRRFTLRITTGASGAITWDTSWGRAPYIPPSSTVSVTFINTAATSATPTWTVESPPSITRHAIEMFGVLPVSSSAAQSAAPSTTAFYGAATFNTDGATTGGTSTWSLRGQWSGTYTLTIYGARGNNTGIMKHELSKDSGTTWTTLAASVDTYAVSAAASTWLYTGIAIPEGSDVMFRITSTGKNASSSAYYYLITGYEMQRTGA